MTFHNLAWQLLHLIKAVKLTLKSGQQVIGFIWVYIKARHHTAGFNYALDFF